MENARAQVIGQIFVFILAGLVFVLIISYGYKAILQFTERQEQVMIADFRNDFEHAIDSISRDYGSVRKAEFRLPSEFKGVCVFDYNTCANTNPMLDNIKVTWAREACAIKTANVFTVPSSSANLDLSSIIVSDGYVCVEAVDGRVEFRLEGTGRKAKVSKWS